MQFKKAAAVLVGATLLMGGLAAATPATADTVTFDSWIETEDKAPFSTTEGLVFYLNASINYGHQEGTSLQDLVPLKDVSGLAYTVTESASPVTGAIAYAPSYQLGIVNKVTGVTYARLVWEPYHQKPSPGDDKGTYTDLENGLWWGANVWKGTTKEQPFGTAEGSQSKPQPLSFFKTYFGTDAQISFFSVKQGSTSNIVSTVTSVTFTGDTVALGNADKTPYSAGDLTGATEPLKNQLATVNTALTTEKATTASLQAQLVAAKTALTTDQATALTQLVAAQNQATKTKAKLVSISGTEKVGKTVTAKFGTDLTGVTVKYQWYVGGKAVKGATKATYKIPGSAKGKKITVTVTGSKTGYTATSRTSTAKKVSK